ncbi:MAG: hypothetical protein ACRD7E_09095 [Bryobacteraceae bacterium]
MLCLADRFFPSYKLWQQASSTGAELLWRTRQNARLDVERRFRDGSYLSRIYSSPSDRRNRRKGIIVRVIDYRLKGVDDAEPIYRLITTILDPKQAPPRELAALSRKSLLLLGVSLSGQLGFRLETDIVAESAESLHQLLFGVLDIPAIEIVFSEFAIVKLGVGQKMIHDCEQRVSHGQ